MGVKHFYLWYRRKFEHCIRKNPPPNIDNFAIDLNGLFHLCAQKVYRYGNVNAPRLLSSRYRPTLNMLCREICHKIDVSKRYVQPQKRLILCVDGIAGLGKMNQQRQRRFRSAQVNHGMEFDPNSFTPGTELMDYLTRYIDGYIKAMISTSVEWQGLEVVFSNEKVAGEGEHKIMQYMKKIDRPFESLCIYGLDADLIMLGMLLPVHKVCIFREMEYDVFQVLEIESFKHELVKLMRWDKYLENDVVEDETTGKTNLIKMKSAMFSTKMAVYDFVVLCFLVGNDFLPTIPSMAILDGTIDVILDNYKRVCREHGHIVKQHPKTKKLTFRIPTLKIFLNELAKYEKEFLEKKYNDGQTFFPDPLVLKNLHPDKETGMMKLDFESYKRDYYKSKFSMDIKDIKPLVHKYMDGMTWVINYYVSEIPDWLWYFPYLYAPFLSCITDHIDDYKDCEFDVTRPIDPFLQLLVVMPPASKELVPNVFHSIYEHNSSLLQYYPTEFNIDVSGKRKEWEGIVQLPPISLHDFQDTYTRLKSQLNDKDKKRNIQGKSFTYSYDHHPQSASPITIKTSYGLISDYRVKSSILYI